MPTKVKSIEDYKERIHEIFDWQIRQTIGIRTMLLSFVFKEKVSKKEWISVAGAFISTFLFAF